MLFQTYLLEDGGLVGGAVAERSAFLAHLIAQHTEGPQIRTVVITYMCVDEKRMSTNSKSIYSELTFHGQSKVKRE